MHNKLFRLIVSDVLSSEKPWEDIKKWRKTLGVKAKNVAKKMGVSPSVISDYESGRRKSPGSEMIKRLVSTILELSGIKEFDSVRAEEKRVSFDEYAREINGSVVVHPENKEASGIIRITKENVLSVGDCKDVCVVSDVDGIVFVLLMLGCKPNFFAVKSVSDIEKKIAKKFGIGIIVF